MLNIFIILVRDYFLDVFVRSQVKKEGFIDIKMSATELYPSAPLEPNTSVVERLERNKKMIRASMTFFKI